MRALPWLAAVVVLSFGATAWAEKAPKKKQPPVLLPPAALEKLQLDNTQKEKIAQLQKEFEDKTAVFQQAFLEAVKAAKQNNDKAKAKEAAETFRTKVATVQAELQGKVQALLNDDQKKTLAGLKAVKAKAGPKGTGIAQLLPAKLQDRLNLTEEQKAKLALLQKETEAKLKALLTTEQKELLATGGKKKKKP